MKIEFQPVAELVLPSGRFATFRKITVEDLVITHADNQDSMLWHIRIASRVMLLDGAVCSLNDLLDMDVAEGAPIMKWVTLKLGEAFSEQTVKEKGKEK